MNCCCSHNLLNEQPLENLNHHDLSHSIGLIKFPDFSLLPNLEEILLGGCVRLSRIHQSIGVLGKLTVFNLSGCKNLGELPSSMLEATKTYSAAQNLLSWLKQ